MQNNNTNNANNANNENHTNNSIQNNPVDNQKTLNNQQDEVLEPEILDDATYARSRNQGNFTNQTGSGFGANSYHSASHSGQNSGNKIYTYFIRTGNPHQGFQGQGNTGQGNNFFGNYALSSQQNTSCLPSFVSLFLVLFVLFQLGFLAMLGFIFFLFIGKAISLIINFKNIMNGKLIPPILLDCAVWIISFSLVTWLSS